MARSVAVLVLVTAVAGCGTSGDRSASRTVVERFYDAIRDDDGDAACEQLAAPTVDQLESQSGQECRDAVTGLELEGGAVVDVQVYVTNATVGLRGGESAFLSLEPEGWRLSAIGCTPEKGPPRETPFECEVAA